MRWLLYLDFNNFIPPMCREIRSLWRHIRFSLYATSNDNELYPFPLQDMDLHSTIYRVKQKLP